MAEQLFFRVAQETDLQSVLALYHSVLGNTFCTWNEEYPGSFEIKEDTKTGNLFLLLDGDSIIGAISIVPVNEMDAFIEWNLKNNVAEFARVVISPAWQGKGLAGLLVDHVLEEMKNRAYKAVHISIAKVNTPALKTYLQKGFVLVGEKEMYGNRYYLAEKAI